MFNPFNADTDYVLIETSAHSIETTGQIDIVPEQYRVAAVSGYGANPDGIFKGTLADKLSSQKTVRDIADSIGEWLVIAINEKTSPNSSLIFTDSFGYSPCFYSVLPGIGIAVGASFYGVVQALRDYQKPPSLDLDNYIATLATSHQLFDNPTTHRTMSNDIRILPMDQAIYVTPSEASFIDRTKLTPHIPSHYQDQLRCGIDFSTRTLSALSTELELERVLYLSGGVDSRTILALLRAASIERRFKISSRDPRKARPGYSRNTFSGDIRITNLIRQEFDLEWIGEGNKHNIPWTFRESLAAFQSYRSNYSYAYVPTASKHVYATPRMTLSGGGGEILRSTDSGLAISTKINRELQNEGANHAKQLENWLVTQLELGSEFETNIRSVYQEWLAEKPSASLENLLNYHYLHNRNRTHFGHGRYSASGNEVLFHPLSNPYFLAAAESLHFDDRAAGKLILDLFGRTSPELLDFVFENSKWTERLATAGASAPADEDSWIADYDRAITSGGFDEHSTTWVSGRYCQPEENTTSDVSQQYLVLAFRLIEDFVDPGIRNKLRSFHDDVMRLINESKLDASKYIAKVTSATDVFFPAVTTGRGRTFGLTDIQKQPPRQWSNLRYVVPSLPQDGWNNVVLRTFTPSLTRHDSKIVARTGSGSYPDNLYEFAFYLFKDGKRIASRWYGLESYAVFPNDGPGKYRLDSFIRKRGDKNPLLVKKVVENIEFS